MTDADGFALPAGSHIGRAALGVGALDDVLPFYRDALGFAARSDGGRAVLAAGGTPLLELAETPAPPRGSAAAGLFHVAVRLPDRAALADALTRLRAAGAELTGASDHDVSEALYLRDPEGNGVELYCDRPETEWAEEADGRVRMGTRPLDLDDLAAAGSGDPAPDLPGGTDVGHVHLEVTDLPAAEAFYADALGMNVRARYGDDAAFLAAGGYHHHVGLNVWNGRTEPAGESRGLDWFEVVVPDDGTVATLADRFERAGYAVESDDDGLRVRDPDGIAVRVRGE